MVNTEEKRYFENLDALRFVAFLLVFISHAFFSFGFNNNVFTTTELSYFNHLGRIGVDFFLVLSSFLITWIIEEEFNAKGNFDARNFLIRRTLRIWPLYFLIVFAAYIVIFLQTTMGNQSGAHSNPGLFWFILFWINFYIVSYGDNFLFSLVFLWSIAIEEQFYIVWAVIMKFAQKYLVIICPLLISISLIHRFINLHNNYSLYFHTFSALGNFAIGALTAHLAFHDGNLSARLARLKKWHIGIIYMALLICILFYRNLFAIPVMIISERVVFSLLFAFVIFEQCFCHNSFFKAGNLRFFDSAGKISYGLYCYHGVAITGVIQLLRFSKIKSHPALTFGMIPLVVFLLTYVISLLSYKYFEKPFLNLRKKFY